MATRQKKTALRSKKSKIAAASSTASPEKQLAGFIGKFAPGRATEIRAARRKMRALLPQATEIVYDN